MNLGPLKTVGLVIAVLVALVWSEWISGQHPKPGPVQVVYWEKWTGFEADAMRKVVDAFNASQKKIHVQFLSISGVENKTLMAVAGGDPPDVAGLYGPNVAQYADDNAVIPLDKYCARAGIKRSQYVPAFFDIGAYRNHIYALPSTPASTALHYNKSMLKAAGYDRPPTTIEQMDDMCVRLLKRKNGKVAQVGFMPAEPGWWNWAWVYFFGGRLWDGHAKVTANDPANVRAFTWIQSFSKMVGTQNLQTFRSGFGNFSSPQNAFLDGQVAMEIQGVWMYNFISKYSPALQWGAVPFPHPADRPDLANMTIADEDVLVIPRGAHHPNSAFQFIKFVESQKGMEMLCLGQRKNSPLLAVSKHFWRVHPNPFIHLFSDLPLGKNTIAAPKMGIWPEYQTALNNAFDQVVLMQETPQEALDDVQNEMQPKWDEYRERLRQRGLLK